MSGPGAPDLPDAIVYWRRLDVPGLERLALARTPDGAVATSTLVGLDDGGFRLDYRWVLDRDGCTIGAAIERTDARGTRVLRIERAGGGWRVDDTARPDLDGAIEADLSATPFCNTLAIRRMPAGRDLELDVAHVDAATLTVVRSRQRYLRRGRGRLRYVDLGTSAGFEADLEVDANGLVVRYGSLFAREQPVVDRGAGPSGT